MKQSSRNRDPQMLTWFRLVRVIKKLTRQMDQPMLDFDLTRYQFDLLMQVVAEPGINQQKCADQMNVTKGNITQHLDRLEARGLVRRTKIGRENQLFLTLEGEALIARIIPEHDARVKEILSPLTENEIHQFQSILRKLDRSLK